MVAHALTPWGILLPGSTLHQGWFLVLAGFVAVNTIVYVTLAVTKALPRVYLRDWVPRKYIRSETRSIHPDGTR